MRFPSVMILACAVAAPALAKDPAIHPAVVTDPRPDAAYPAGMSAFVIPAQDGAMNAVLYTAAGAGIHPTLLLLHGFPGNEQNLDLAQAARRAGWNVLTLHYRGSWGSPGRFSFGNASEDAFAALQFLQQPSTVARYRIDTSAIVVAGHSMGGFMAADAAAAEPRVAGLFLIDPWDPAQTVAALATPEGEADWKAEVAGDLPPLAGATYDSLTGEIRADGAKFDLGRRLAGYGRRPLSIIGAERGIGAMARKVAADAQGANPDARLMVWPTDHGFSDKRIALADALVRFLAGVAPTIR
ncbi:MAG TPA: alpha/beta hydrolase [Sphingobium sp.]|uniref:alpha/beta hydrolase family protein n=1 Tax=unclassified Sphingobium TaxID=2611147 RepID=UPI0007F5182F|nr:MULTISPECIES: alpha/beta hydrolase [unclassified Sphingobium]OAN53629.1 alpha/beta hydrolase [Sphingobium sp. TCM1]WIW89979.1 alpha/beta fold hydrolase [Sphingobium sp. V4]HAF40195.1 alpha/beta hydrolase [Sphingobium sp.]